ncbi:Calx-beta domain-containing protein [Thermophagus sp. OGC60D27]|uniref:Calx-beta domain-containing protein n=1 Tax=Thermophagus sp. OGC60D27 TaxID=3458415 RepID=UPI004037CAD4
MSIKSHAQKYLFLLLFSFITIATRGQTVTLSLAGSPLNEETGTATLTVETDLTILSDIIVNLTFSGTATYGIDYSAENTITIPAGAASTAINITAETDDHYEFEESIIVDIANVINATENGEQQVTATIIDPEDIPEVTLTADQGQIAEGTSSNITATLSNPTYEAVTVALTATDINTESGDYTLSNGSLIIAAGETEASTTLTAAEDDIFEGDEQLQLSISGVTGGGAVFASPQTATITITDLQTAPTVTLDANSLSISENTGTSTLTATLTGPVESETTITLAVTGGSADEEDYTLPGSITINAGETTGSTSLTTSNDNTFEGSETLQVSISGVPAGFSIGTPSSVNLTITDDEDAPAVTLSASPLQINEGSSSTITVILSNPADEEVSVSLSITDIDTESGDYTLADESLTIAAGETSATTSLEANTDNLFEGNEQLQVAISGVPAGFSIGTPSSVNLTITDDEDAPAVTLSASPLQINEGSSSTITVTLSNPADEEVSVSLSITDIDTESGDYTLADESLTIAAGETSATTSLEAFNDNFFEGSETLQVSISGVPAGFSIGTPSFVNLTITDDEDAPAVTLSASPLQINEGSSSTITVTLSNPTNEEVSVSLSITDIDTESGDYTLADESLTIAAGETSATTSLEANTDNLFEGNEQLQVAISDVSGGEAAVTAPQTATITITEQQAAPTVSLSATPLSISENGGLSTLTATLTVATTEQVIVSLNATGGTATPDDYALPASVTIGSGNLAGSTTVTAINNDRYAPDKSIIIEITGVEGGSALPASDEQSVKIIIEDDEIPPSVSLSATPTSLTEDGGSSTITATLNRATFEPVTISLAANNGSAENEDYQLTSNTITIPAGALSGQTFLNVQDDNIYEGGENLSITISGVSGGDATENGNQTINLFILDDETPPLVSLSVIPQSITENQSSTVTATLDNATEETVLVVLETTNISTENNDYNLASYSISIPAGSTSGSTTLDAISDNLYEGDEELGINISQVAGGSATIDGSQEASITIEDMQSLPEVSLNITGSPFSEDGGSAVLMVALSHASTQAINVGLAYSGQADNEDYSGQITSLTISPYEIQETITLRAINDREAEGDETLSISLSSVVNASVGEPQEVSAIILDDDIAGIKPVISGSGTITSESGTVDNITIELNTEPAANVVIQITGLDASEGSLNTSELTFTPQNWDTPQIVTITGVDDNEADDDITYTLTFAVINERSDPAYHDLSVPINVINTDNDAAGFTINTTNTATVTSETGTTDIFSVVLNSRPYAEVVFEIMGLDSTEGMLSAEELTFTPDNWNQPQTVIITGVDDNETDGDISYTLTIEVIDERSDEAYHGQSNTLLITNADDDSAGLILEPQSATLETSEEGLQASFNLRLASQPASNVVIAISGLDESEGLLSRTTLIYTPENWNQSQKVTITGRDDEEVDGSITYALRLAVDNDNSDENYHDLSILLNVTNTDNDQANQAPTPVDDTYQTDQDRMLNGSSLLANDSDPNNHELTINTTPITPPENGTLEINPDGTFTYTPNEGFAGTDSFDYEVCDNETPPLCATASVSILVVAISDHDNDGIPTNQEGYMDTDNDGVPNYLDTDSDGDGVNDSEEGTADCDGDQIPDYLDTDPCYEVPEGFSPNNDGINETLKIPWVQRYNKVTLMVFNRWGSQVYRDEKFSGQWDGTSNSGVTIGKKLPAGTYYYIITIGDINKTISGYFFIAW